jgi:hypothetical protein
MTSSPTRSGLLLAFASALGLAWATPATAQPPAAVMLHTSTCQPQADAELRRALEVELQALNIEPRWASTDAVGAPAPITLSAECDGESGSVSLRVWASEPRLVLSRFVALRDVDEPARARTLALVISEALGPALASDRDDGGLARIDAPLPSGAAPAVAPARSSRQRGRRGSRFARSDPYDDELFTTTNPYGMPHAFRVGTSAQARLAMRDSSVLLGGELAVSAPVSDRFDAALELSYASSTSWSSALQTSWWSLALGTDFVHFDAIGLAAGPRLSFGYLSVTGDEWYDPSTEHTIVAQLGVRSKFEVPIDDRLSALMTFGAQHTFGVYALTHYTGLDEGLNGWVVSWSLGLSVEP